MSTVATSQARRRPAGRGTPVRRPAARRVPLATVYVWLCVVYAVEAWGHVTPWLFTDELELTQLSRSIAATGHAARRGAALHLPDSLYTYLIAPLWLIHDVAAAYDGDQVRRRARDDLGRLPDVLPRTARRRAAGRALRRGRRRRSSRRSRTPSFIVEETLAYPYAALCFFLIAKALRCPRAPRQRWVAAAVAASALAPAVRGELVVIPAALALAALFAVVVERRAHARGGATWSIGDWVGAVVLALRRDLPHQRRSAATTPSEWHDASHARTSTGSRQHGRLGRRLARDRHRRDPARRRLAALFRAPGRGPHEPRAARVPFRRARRRSSSFGLYTAMKAAYLSTVFATRVEERNLIYIAPLLFVGTALVVSSGGASTSSALAVAGAYAIYLVGYALYHVTQYPYQMGVQLYSDALGFAILQQANRFSRLDADVRARGCSLAISVVGVLALCSRRGSCAAGARRRRSSSASPAVAVARLEPHRRDRGGRRERTRSAAQSPATTLRQPLHLGRRCDAPASRRCTWARARSTRTRSGCSSSGTARSSASAASTARCSGPGPSGSPNVKLERRLYWQDDPNAPDARSTRTPSRTAVHRLRRNAGRVAPVPRAAGATRRGSSCGSRVPNRLRAACIGIYADGWTRRERQHVLPLLGSTPGWLRIVSRARDWGDQSGPTPVRIVLAQGRHARQGTRARCNGEARSRRHRQHADEGRVAPRPGGHLRRARRGGQEVHPERLEPRRATCASSGSSSRIGSSGPGRADEREPEAEDRRRERAAALEQLKPRRSARVCGTKNGAWRAGRSRPARGRRGRRRAGTGAG